MQVVCKIVLCCWQKCVMFEGVYIDVCKCVLLLARDFVVGSNVWFRLAYMLLTEVCVVVCKSGC